MDIRVDDVVRVGFKVHNFDGELTDADFLPVGSLRVAGASDATVVTVTNVGTGEYEASFTVPGWGIGSYASLTISVIVDAVVDKAALSFVVRAYPDNFEELAIETGTGSVTTDVQLTQDNIDDIAEAVGTPAQVHNQEPVASRTAKLGSRRDGVMSAFLSPRVIPGVAGGQQVWIDCSAQLSTNIQNVTGAVSSNADFVLDSAGMYGKYVSLVIDAEAASAGETTTITCNVAPYQGQVLPVTLVVPADAD